jgi:hypothetical protein
MYWFSRQIRHHQLGFDHLFVVKFPLLYLLSLLHSLGGGEKRSKPQAGYTVHGHAVQNEKMVTLILQDSPDYILQTSQSAPTM